MIVGVISCSISGALRAISAKMDITGAIFIAFIAANGGGTIRDLILGSTVFWIKEQYYIWLSLTAGAITFIIIYYEGNVINKATRNLFLIATDAMGLAAFALAGVEKSFAFQQNTTIAILMGCWTAVGGGMIADIFVGRTPFVLSQELYITVAFLGAVIYILLGLLVNNFSAALVAVLFMISLRLLSVKFNWRFPLIR
jgi:uncharacterized membrane protein YeiH